MGCHHECRYDEFGFRLEDEDSPHRGKRLSSSSSFSSNCKKSGSGSSPDAAWGNNCTLPPPPLELASHRDEWIGYLEFAHSDNTHAELTWDQVDRYLDKTERLCTMITERGQYIHTLYPQCTLIIVGNSKANVLSLWADFF